MNQKLLSIDLSYLSIIRHSFCSLFCIDVFNLFLVDNNWVKFNLRCNLFNLFYYLLHLIIRLLHLFSKTFTFLSSCFHFWFLEVVVHNLRYLENLYVPVLFVICLYKTCSFSLLLACDGWVFQPLKIYIFKCILLLLRLHAKLILRDFWSKHLATGDCTIVELLLLLLSLVSLHN